MERNIFVFGHGDKSGNGFSTENDLIDYMKRGVFEDNDGRYRFSQTRNADVIILSRDGLMFGHFDIESHEEPTDDDLSDYPPVKCVYLVRRSHIYSKPVALGDLDIAGIQFGKKIPESTLAEILKLAEPIQKFGD